MATVPGAPAPQLPLSPSSEAAQGELPPIPKADDPEATDETFSALTKTEHVLTPHDIQALARVCIEYESVKDAHDIAFMAKWEGMQQMTIFIVCLQHGL